MNSTAGETCDDGNGTNGDGCDNDCTVSGCGDGAVEPERGLRRRQPRTAATAATPTARSRLAATVSRRPARPATTADASATCDADCTLATCGDGTTNTLAGEECDTSGESNGCDADCTLRVCGDGTVNGTAGETCDDGNLVNGDGCDANCTPTGCGNGVVTAPELCDDGANNGAGSGFCLADCSGIQP